MTAEVALLNKSAVALAADSAVTIDSPLNSGGTKVFNSANKLFTLSKFHPVGAMVYNTMSLGGVPWEAIIKTYRRTAHRRSFSLLSDYCDDFFSFCSDNLVLFPEKRQHEVVRSICAQFFLEIREGSATNKTIRQSLDQLLEKYSKSEKCDVFDEDSLLRIEKLYRDVIDSAAAQIFTQSQIRNLKQRCRRAASEFLINADLLHGYSGLVFAGFGEDQMFPAIQEYYVDAVVDGKIKRRPGVSSTIEYGSPSAIFPFAQKDMVRTFIEGVNPRYGSQFIQEATKLVANLVVDAINKFPDIDGETKARYLRDIAPSVRESFLAFVRQMDGVRNNEHKRPIETAISVMPLSELANVAEILVGLTQIRQRLSIETETVGGPIDVAVISKGDGFVWIRRKHYFEQNINPLFIEKYFDTTHP